LMVADDARELWLTGVQPLFSTHCHALRSFAPKPSVGSFLTEALEEGVGDCLGPLKTNRPFSTVSVSIALEGARPRKTAGPISYSISASDRDVSPDAEH